MYAYGQLMLNDRQFFFIGVGSPYLYHLQLYKMTYGEKNLDWADRISWTSSRWSALDSDSVLGRDQSIYSIFIFGSTERLYLTNLNPHNGSVLGTRYRSNFSCSIARKTLINDDYLIITSMWSVVHIILFNTVTSTFDIKKFTGLYLNGCILEPTTNK